MTKARQMHTESIPKLLLKFSLPATAALIVNALYNVVDSIFVGRGVGELGLAGVTVCFPILTTYIAFIMLIGMGATALISIKLGEGKPEEAESIVGNAFLLLIVMSFVLTAFGLIFTKEILLIFGATENVLPYSVDYLRVLLIGSVFLTLGTGMNSFIRAEGKAKTAMVTMLLGAVTNIALDYVFIFIFDWGIKGAAAATVISYVVTSTWLYMQYALDRGALKLRLENLKIKISTSKQIIKMGFPTFVIQVNGSIQQLILHRSLAKYGGDLALAAIGVIMSITTFLVMPAMGIGQGAQPILGFNKGAGDQGRVRKTLGLSILWATLVIIFGQVVSIIWPSQLISLFNDNEELLEIGMHGMKIFFKLIPLVSVQMLGANYFQAIGKARQATWLGLLRQVLIFIPLLIILPYFWGLEGVWWSAPMSDLGAFLVTGTWLIYDITKQVRQERKIQKLA